MKENVIDITELHQDVHNFNKGTETGGVLMQRSFKELGAGRSILIDKHGNIIAGNKSHQAAIAAGIKNVRVIETNGDELVAVKRMDVDIDSAEGRRMAYLDNLTTQVNLEWDADQLRQVQEDIEGFDISDYGVDIELPADPDEAEKVKEDDFNPDEKCESFTNSGDIFQLGIHRLMCGDSTKKEDVAKLMQGEKADLWLTDPPYNVAVKNSQGMTIQNDNMESNEFRTFLRNAFAAVVPVMAKGCPFYVWFASKEHLNFEGALNDVGLYVRQELIWNKNHFILGRSHYQWKHEPCLYGWQGDVCRYFTDARNRASVYQDGAFDIDSMKKEEMRRLLHDILDMNIPQTVIDCEKPTVDADHPTMKPVRLFAYQISNSSLPGGIILDTFGGSGTTIVAAEQLGRKARLMELDCHYCDVIIARWEKLTGKKAVKIWP